MTLLSIVLPTKDREGRIGKLSEAFDSIEGQHNPPKYEIIVVDENPRSGVEKLIENSKLKNSIKFIPLPGAGIVAATNEAIKRASGDIILFLGDDTTADPMLLAEHAKSHEAGGNIAVLGWTKWHPRVRKTPLSVFARSIGPQLDMDYIPKDRENLPFYFFMTANLSIQKQALLSAGLFDADFRYPAFEDCELGYRLTQNGVRITFNERAVAYHNHEMTLAQFCDRQRKIGHGMVVFNRKHPEEKTIAGRVAECRRQPFGAMSSRLITALLPYIERRTSTALSNFSYMMLYNIHLSFGVREELSGVEYAPAKESY